MNRKLAILSAAVAIALLPFAASGMTVALHGETLVVGDSLDGSSSAFKDSINAITRVSAVRRSANFLIGFEPEFAL